MHDVNYPINGFSSSRTSQGALHCRGNIVAVITQDKVIDDNF